MDDDIYIHVVMEQNNIQMYHGGKRWSRIPTELVSAKKNRYEGGIGIYTTNKYETARRYAKGSRVVHLLEIDKNFVDIATVKAPLKELLNVVKTVRGMKNKDKISEDLVSYSTRTGRDEISLEILNNLVINHEAGAGTAGLEISGYFSYKGGDVSLQPQHDGEVWMVIFDPKIIKGLVVVDPSKAGVSFPYMLPPPR